MARTLLWLLLILVIAGVLFAGIFFWLDQSRAPKADLKEYWDIPEFKLIAEDGSEFRPTDLKGRVWVLDFIFTRCAGPCPIMSSTMGSLQGRLPKEVQFVSITVDPAWDTPERLTEYAKGQKAQPGRWRFLTGERGVIYQLARDLQITAVETPDEFIHSNRYLLVDRKGKVRGIPFVTQFDREKDSWTVNEETREQVVADVKALVGEGVPARIRSLPPINAGLNAASGLMLLLGFLFIKGKKVAAHKTFMVMALLCSVVFLATYLTYHYYAGSTKFAGVGWSRPLYFGVLLSHSVLAAITVPLAAITVFHALRGTIDKHKRLARWTFPIWMYVSVTGVLVYFMLYHWFA